MRLVLTRADLKAERAKVECSEVVFSDFKEEIQEAIIEARKATFYDGEEKEQGKYKIIYP